MIIIAVKGGVYRNRNLDEYLDYLRERTDKERKKIGKDTYSNATIITLTTNAFLIEKREDINFVSRLKDADSLKKAEARLVYYLSGIRKPESNVEYYINCMQRF